MKDYNFAEGEVLLFDKPLEWTSFDVVKKVRNTVRVKKVGHAGTLDPLATGLLILCTGKKTKSIEGYQAQEKEYTGELVLGETRPSIDMETEVDATFEVSHITEEMIHATTEKFTGLVSQVPPMHSAIKVDGQRMYKVARKGKEVEIKPRDITISEFEITNIDFPRVEFRVVCSKGTYIRSLVRDFGKALDSGAYMSKLVRTRIGEFKLEDAWELPKFVETIKEQQQEKVEQ